MTNAYNTTLAAMRQARDNAVSQRTSYSVTFSRRDHASRNTITVAPTLAFQGEPEYRDLSIADGCVVSGASRAPLDRPRMAYGTGIERRLTLATRRAGQAPEDSSVIYFCPDGSAQSARPLVRRNWNGGVVYIARSGDLLSSRAITLWGGTGRVHGWRLYSPMAGRLSMATSIIGRGANDSRSADARRESGFSLIEVMISMAVLTVGMVSLLGVFGLAMASTQTSQQDMIAKQLANEALESIVTARNTSQISWDAIQNVTGSATCHRRRQPAASS